MTDEGQDVIEDFLQSQFEADPFAPAPPPPTGGYAEAVGAGGPAWPGDGYTEDFNEPWEAGPAAGGPGLANVSPNFMPPSPVQGTSQWTNNPGLPPAQATVRQMAQDYGPLGSSAGLFESPAMAARREELQRAAEEAAAVEYQRDNEADDRMREEEAQRQEIEDRLAEMQSEEAGLALRPDFLF